MEKDKGKKKGIIVDIDGTLANVDHRLHHLKKNPKDWHSFHSGLTKDTPNNWCVELILGFKERGFSIILLTGRGEEYRFETEAWLKAHHIPSNELFMRGAKDRTPDDLVKKTFYETRIAPQYAISFVVEDRKSVVTMWRELGLVCLQCAWGDF